ncbi:hypothetical protein GCM10022254_14520 [Actinomadura meridiana]|uniref:Uncharacterized protein n=1 Tax=Actinomadura meridiana TaxID=559626 RepID=A0ABP8BV58_9ACTN
MRNPPISGPAMLDTAKIIAEYPWYLARSLGSNKSPVTANIELIRHPAAAPCTTRNAISQSMDGAAPHAADPAKKPSSPTNRTTRRPNRSPSRPDNGTVTLVASTYAVDTQASRSSPPRSPTIVGSAVPRTVASNEDIRPPSISPPKTTTRCR